MRTRTRSSGLAQPDGAPDRICRMTGACCGFACPLAVRRVESVVCDLALWSRWWPGVTRVRALPGGCQRAGDAVVLEGPRGDAVLRVLAHVPGESLRCRLEAPGVHLQLDIAWHAVSAGCALRLGLSQPHAWIDRWRPWRTLWLRIRTLLRARALQRMLLQQAARS